VDCLLVVLDKIIAAGGCVVPGELLRTGRRAVRKDGKKARPHHAKLAFACALLVNCDEHTQSSTFNRPS
jgi:hypothetical protein